jgi:hypothetical protein
MHFITGKDTEIGAWLFEKAKATPRSFNRAIGIENDRGELVGGFMFTGWNGSTLEAHFWGPSALTRQAVRFLFTTAINEFNAAGVIVRASRANTARGMRKLGAELIRSIEFGEFLFNRKVIESLSGITGK